MNSFPTLYRHSGSLTVIQPDEEGYSEGVALDPTIRTVSEAGYVVTRARFTALKDKWHVKLSMVSTTNKVTVRQFEKARECGSEAFTWTDPAGTSHTVRFLGMATYIPVPKTNYHFWDIEFDLEEQ